MWLKFSTEKVKRALKTLHDSGIPQSDYTNAVNSIRPSKDKNSLLINCETTGSMLLVEAIEKGREK